MISNLGHIKLTKKRKDDDNLRILQLTDIHYFHAKCEVFETKGRRIEVNSQRYSNKKIPAFVEKIVRTCNPDLVILTGDIIDGRVFKNMPRNSWREAFMDIVRPINDLSTPWTFCPGNHDDDHSPWSRSDLLQIYQLEGCVSKKTKSFDHTMSIGFDESEGESTRLWIFDSGGNNIKNPDLRYESFKCVETFRTKTKSIPPSSTEIAYFHIPIPQCEGLTPVKGRNGLFDAALKSGMVPFPWNYVPFLVRILGKDRVVGSSKIESGMYNAIVDRGILACFFGHDHFSDAVFYRDQVYFGYGRVSGFTPPIDWEGDAGTIPFKRGGRVVEITKSGNVSTWIHNEAGIEEANTRLEMSRNRRRNVSYLISLCTAAALSMGVIYQYYSYFYKK